MVRVDAEPEGWRPTLTVGVCVCVMTADEADNLSVRLAAAAAETRRKNEAERVLPLAERVWLHLARLCYMPAVSIAIDLGAPRADVSMALESLVEAKRVRHVAGHAHLFEAIHPSGAR